MVAKVMDHFFQKPSSNNTIAATNSDYLWSLASDELSKNIVTFETQMAALTPPEEDMNDITKTYNPMTLTEVAKVLPQISFEHIITELPLKTIPPTVSSSVRQLIWQVFLNSSAIHLGRLCQHI
jgi:predicted metalloendopeptidase